ncbi:MAG: hypothetical protein D6737_14365 [Chloroflexi bacterium]|nr:MAG: hypothetical protein D6737_14365 [Chloroflexota bacterium]
MWHKTDQQIRMLVDLDAETAANNLMANLRRASWTVSYSETFMTIDEVEVYQLFGISSAFAGATLSGFVNQGARHVPFFVKINSIDAHRSEVLIIAGGSQSVTGKDYGRNRNVAEKLQAFCRRPPGPSVAENLGGVIKGIFNKGDKKKR